MVDDGSTDRDGSSGRVGGRPGDLPCVQRGKGRRDESGRRKRPTPRSSSILDADLMGLTPDHVDELAAPVVHLRPTSHLGIFDEGRFTTDIAQKITPFLSGQRAMRRSIILEIPHLERTSLRRGAGHLSLRRAAHAPGRRGSTSNTWRSSPKKRRSGFGGGFAPACACTGKLSAFPADPPFIKRHSKGASRLRARSTGSILIRTQRPLFDVPQKCSSRSRTLPACSMAFPSTHVDVDPGSRSWQIHVAGPCHVGDAEGSVTRWAAWRRI